MTKCPTCVEANERSRVYPLDVPEVLRPAYKPTEFYVDEDGECHTHYPNPVQTGWKCSNGHAWIDEQWYHCFARGCRWMPHRVIHLTEAMEALA